MIAEELQHVVENYYINHQPIEKSKAVDDITSQLRLHKQGKLYLAATNEYAVRFSYSTKDSFANTVLALKNVLKYDHLPIILCLLKPDTFQLTLVNTTFLKKITHSSQALTETNIRGSFLGHDIIRNLEIDGIGMVSNDFKNFDILFRYHQSIETVDNITRLVAATAGIAQKDEIVISEAMRSTIHSSIAYSFERDAELQQLKTKFDQQVQKHKEQILNIVEEEAANVNLRGNRIEQLISSAGLNQHGLADETILLQDGGRVLLDFKTSTGSASANAKLYNVDKLLEALSDGRTISAVYLIHIDIHANQIITYLLNSFDEVILDHLVVQHHWSGRNSRGATQLSVKVFRSLAARECASQLNLERAVSFVNGLISRQFL